MDVGAQNPLTEYMTLRDIAGRLGSSYMTAYNLVGQLGEPIRVGRTQLFPRSVAEPIIARRLAERRARTGDPFTAA